MKAARIRPVLLVAVVLAMGLVGCLPGPNPLKDAPVTGGGTAGFWLGFWHGLLGPVTFVMSLFKDANGFYEVHNNGGWYNAGFLLGLTIVLGGGFQGNVQLRRGSGTEPLAPPAPTKQESGGGEAPEPRKTDQAGEPEDDGRASLPPRGPRPGPAN
jgi:hypothetical protein